MEQKIEIVRKSDIPPRRGPIGTRNPLLKDILSKLPNLRPDEVIKVTFETRKQARYTQCELRYYRTNRGRPGPPLYSNLRSSYRGNILFVWNEV